MGRIADLRERMDAAAERIAKVQAGLFLNLFYILFVPVAYVYLRVRGRLHHRVTGYFETPEHLSNSLADAKRQW